MIKCLRNWILSIVVQCLEFVVAQLQKLIRRWTPVASGVEGSSETLEQEK